MIHTNNLIIKHKAGQLNLAEELELEFSYYEMALYLTLLSIWVHFIFSQPMTKCNGSQSKSLRLAISANFGPH
ncbi:hypothetical protein BIY27_00030 [Gibbsiella quercinecans]|nr:hypothetical protein BIY27_00030 [Gibbsiella quercinecans]